MAVLNYKLLPVEGFDKREALLRMRLNCFGSLYYFIKIALQRRRLTDKLHRPICDFLERDRLKDLLEMPRDHFKSTICSEGLPMWRCLYLNNEDRDYLAKLGYSDAFIAHMDKLHRADMRVLLVSENITNAAKLGAKIRWHFQSNDVYRTLFPETLPTTKEKWTDYSLHTPRAGSAGSHGEGTFDFIGVGGAIQSRHYGMIIQDDLVGRKAVESPTIMEKTIDFHRLIIGAFEQDDKDHENPELVVGNRWGYSDLNSYIREEEPWFHVTSHSALGGCCDLHPPDTPIFPEEFSFEKLLRFKKRLGSYHFSCQFLNEPTSPEDADFREEWLNFYTAYRDSLGRPVIHFVTPKHAEPRKDLYVGHLQLCMITDPNHGGVGTQCRHAIVVIGQYEDDYFLLDCEAGHWTYDDYLRHLYAMAAKWHLTKFGLETIAAQKYLAYHIQYRNRIEGRNLRIVELKGEVENPDGTMSRNKECRIRNILSPIFQEGRFWTQEKFQEFLKEYRQFPKGKTVDILDALAYVNQMLKSRFSPKEDAAWRQFNLERMNKVRAPYCYAASRMVN